MMNIVLDTNVIVSSTGKNSRLRLIFNSFLQNKYKLLITTDIFFEYLEVMEQRASLNASLSLGEILENSVSVEFVPVHYNWNIIKVDEDDNKFVDCAIAGAADYLVTNDGDFNILKETNFPKVKIITAEEFLEILQQQNDD